jgi:excisionase family DNA binding protein
MYTGPQHGQGEPTMQNALTAKQVATILNVRPSFVYDMARQKKLKSYKVGKYKRFKESAVHDYLARGGA